MIKTGIHNVFQLRKGDNFRGLFGGQRKISVTLYDQILDEPNADELAERILLLFADERGAYKRTYAKRFEAFDNDVLQLMQKYLAHLEHLVVRDVAVSDGRTACDFFEKLLPSFPHIHFNASDYNPTVYVIEKGKTKVTLSHTGKILEVVWPPFVFNAIRHDSYLYYPLNQFVRVLVERFAVHSLIQDYRSGKQKAGELSLFSHRAKTLRENDNRFHLSRHDLLTHFKDQAHVIRAMNVLNQSYFSEEEFSKVISNFYAGLIGGGFLITGSNEEADSLVNGGMYRKTPAGFKRVWQSGDKSPIEERILAFSAH